MEKVKTSSVKSAAYGIQIEEPKKVPETIGKDNSNAAIWDKLSKMATDLAETRQMFSGIDGYRLYLDTIFSDRQVKPRDGETFTTALRRTALERKIEKISSSNSAAETLMATQEVIETALGEPDKLAEFFVSVDPSILDMLGMSTDTVDDSLIYVIRRVKDFIMNVLFMVKGVLIFLPKDEKLGTDAVEKIDGILSKFPEEGKLDEVLGISPKAKYYKNFLIGLYKLIKEVLGLVKQSKFDEAINAILEYTDKLEDNYEFGSLLAELRKSAYRSGVYRKAPKNVDKKNPVDIIMEKIRNLFSVDEKPDENTKEFSKPVNKPDPKAKTDKKQEQKVTPTTEPAAVAAMAQATLKVEDEDDSVPAFIREAAPVTSKEDTGVKPAFIQMNVPVNSGQNAQTPIVLNEPIELDEFDENTKKFFAKYSFVEEIVKIGAQNGFLVNVVPIPDKDGNDRLLQFTAVTANGAISTDRSFTIDLGQVIDRQYAVWPNMAPDGIYFPVENCRFVLRLFMSKKKGSPVDKAVFEKVFKYGFSGLNKDDVHSIQCYGPNLIEANRKIVLITRPKIEDKDINREVTDILVRTAKLIGTIDELKGYRFEIDRIDTSNNDVKITLKNEGVPTYYMGPVPNNKSITLVVSRSFDEKGNPIKETEGQYAGRYAYKLQVID